MFEIEEPTELTEPTTVMMTAAAPEAEQEAPQEPLEPTEAPVEPDEPLEPSGVDSEDPETFPREYVVKLRKEAAGFRERAKRTDDLAQRLHTALVDATGQLADSRDLPFDESHLDDPAKLSEAIATLLADRPHLASRKPAGAIGQGAMPAPDTISLGGLLRAGAR